MRFLPMVLLCACALEEIPGTQVVFDPAADLSDPLRFWDRPWPSDDRLQGAGPDVRGFPNPLDNRATSQLLSIANRRTGFAVNTAGYFRFRAPIAEPAEGTVLLVDLVDGTRHPVVATLLEADDYVEDHLLAVAPVPGVILRPARRYAYVVLRSVKDEKGEALGVPLAMREWLREHEDGFDAVALDVDDIAAATLFTTGDTVRELFVLTEEVRKAHSPAIEALTFEADHPGFCELRGRIRLPQFQRGTPPFDTEGLFTTPPVAQREEDVPVTVTLPKGAMPDGGHPLMLYFHGSGGDSREGVDAGPKDTPDGERRKGEGPASVVGPLGLAMATSALPISPERVPGAGAFDYLNLQNFAAFPDVFRQGVIEQRLFLDALLKLEIPESATEGCSGVSGTHRFDPKKVVALGLSMGGMYTNLVGAVEPRIQVVAPTGAGGYWSWFILLTPRLPDPSLLGALLGIRPALHFLHPVLQLAQSSWEWAEPFVFVPRLARRPLDGHPVRSIYQPVGAQDSYFPEPILDALALAYGNQQAGEPVWPELQDALGLEKRDGLASYPVIHNRRSEDGRRYTGAAVQWAFDGFDGHHVVFQRDAVKHQYGCFFTSWLDTGEATLVAPGAACPGR